MTIQEVKTAVDNGKTVIYNTHAYKVIKDSLGQYFIKCTLNGYCIGLTNSAGDKLNEEPKDFYIS